MNILKLLIFMIFLGWLAVGPFLISGSKPNSYEYAALFFWVGGMIAISVMLAKASS